MREGLVEVLRLTLNDFGCPRIFSSISGQGFLGSNQPLKGHANLSLRKLGYRAIGQPHESYIA